ncbi:Stp1/IreP family PP2C-type Ser/Thr phosphatase [Anoxybacterium hadale]|uniref:Stp1/IreP family PP2C-type Ser/Thr phosphatase n=1 Tax=Anoxybacterium hadale TaxID=3408580 RepID=A0ACD1A7W3_9FIRM|nr:Stp1/IreP family PP2C-type Ser/Thr phosphatase [Clostridiales bacterium]
MTQVGFKTDRGRKRGRNEDSLFVMPKEEIYIVADGVGGQNSGELASTMAVKGIAEYIKSRPLKGAENEDELRSYFLDCMRLVNDLIYQASKQSPENAGMATTAVLLYLNKRTAYFINIGDSRAYIYRDGQISQVTEDHTYVNELVKGGSITRAEAENHPQKNMITRALGGDDKVLPDFYRLDTNKGDIIILCTDGLYGEVAVDEICSMAAVTSSMSTLSRKLVERANENGGHDNITVICLKI